MLKYPANDWLAKKCYKVVCAIGGCVHSSGYGDAKGVVFIA